MTYLIFAFRSRTQSIRFHGELRARGVDAMLINTPRDVSVGCGLSVKLSEQYLSAALGLERSMGLNTFLGAFRVTVNGRTRRVDRLYFD